MVELTFRSAGVSVREIDLSGPSEAQPVGIPAGVIGTANQGPAFVPVTVGNLRGFISRFGNTDAVKFGPLAVSEWLRNAQACTFLRVLGVGTGLKRTTTGNNTGKVTSAGFVVGSQLPQSDGNLGDNPYANQYGPLGRTHILGCFMSQSAGSTIFADAGITPAGDNLPHPIIRGVIHAASGVVPMLSASHELAAGQSSGAPLSDQIAAEGGPTGSIWGTVELTNGAQNFVMLLNGHKGNDPAYPNVLTASFDPTSTNYFADQFNKDPYNIEKAGYVLYTHYDIHPALAVVTGTGIDGATVVTGTFDSFGSLEPAAFLTTASLSRDLGSTTIPNFENYEDRFKTPASPSVISQKFGGVEQRLFRVHARSDGAYANERFKISIRNIRKGVNDNSYGTFDLFVREFDDNDIEPREVEQFSGLTLNPSDDNYIARRIGDQNTYFDFDMNDGSQRLTVDGDHPNVSSFIRVEMDDAVSNGDVDPTALPVGFRGPYHLVTSGSSILASSGSVAAPGQLLALQRAVEPPVPYRLNIAVGQDPKRVVESAFHWGVHFEKNTSVAEPNAGQVANKTIANLTKYQPNFHTTFVSPSVGENPGTADTGGTVLDSDRFNNNKFSLENIQVRTGSDGVADPKEFVSASYVRNGLITPNAALKTRALSVADDFGNLSVQRLAKFSFFIQGGFDGVQIHNREAANLENTAIKQEMDFTARGQENGPTVKAYKKALEVIGTKSEVDIKLLAIPGIRHSVISDEAITTAETRFDAMYIMDIEERDNLNTVVTASAQQADISVQNTTNAFANRSLDTSFAAAYFPDVVMADPVQNVNVRVPPSVAVLGAFALNDAVAFPWFAPAGFTRGALQTTDSVAVNLNRANMDTLYDADINPIVTMPSSDGVVVWGQKTLKVVQSALDRVNVRRLLIDIRRQVRGVAENLLFEPNRPATLARFSSLVNPILQRVQENAGLDRYRVIIDTTTTTQADIENNTIRGKIFLQPTRTAEFISLDFIVSNNGVDV